MGPQPYAAMPENDLLALCIYREARGEEMLGKRGVAHVVCNRAHDPSWWGHDVRSVILHPFQFSSFNEGDPNSSVWPLDDTESAWIDCRTAAEMVLSGTDNDLTNGAVYYWSFPLTAAPWDWGPVVQTLEVGNLHFCKPAPVDMRDVTAET